LRIARVAGLPGEELARAAQRVFLDQAAQRCLHLRAQDPGDWGNELRISIKASQEIRTVITLDIKAGQRSLQVRSSHCLSPGTLISISEGSHTHWSAINRVEGKELSLEAPIPRDFSSASPSYVIAHAFDLSIRDLERQERFERLSILGNSLRFVERIINQQSRLIRVAAHRPLTPLEYRLPMEVEGLLLEGGTEGLRDLGPDDFRGDSSASSDGPGERRGLKALEEVEGFDLLVMPDLMAAYLEGQRAQQSEGSGSCRRFKSLRDLEVVQEAAISFCERSAHCFTLLDLPPGGDFLEAQRWRRQFDSNRAALYYPWIMPADGTRRFIPPSGHIAGIFSRSDAEYGVHKAPANETLEGVVDLEAILQDAHLAILNHEGINCLRSLGARGLRIWGARTLSNEPEWRFLNVRRTVSSISAAIERGSQWAVFEPNSSRLWKQLTRLISSFLMGLREQGMLMGETPEDAFFVQCDEETNPPEQIDLGMLVCRVGLAVTRPVEFIIFRLTQRLEDQAEVEGE